MRVALVVNCKVATVWLFIHFERLCQSVFVDVFVWPIDLDVKSDLYCVVRRIGLDVSQSFF
ncbi:hypothetical protein HanPI659440_Chr17g0666441 [Helianthus annuus]|nr:hypothetical protein HanPI659440_Chr17g0666441 [Helianthus annuus]